MYMHYALNKNQLNENPVSNLIRITTKFTINEEDICKSLEYNSK